MPSAEMVDSRWRQSQERCRASPVSVIVMYYLESVTPLPNSCSLVSLRAAKSKVRIRVAPSTGLGNLHPRLRTSKAQLQHD